METTQPSTQAQNRELVTTMGNLVEALFDEVSVLPLSDGAKEALVTIMVGDIMKRDGQNITFAMPPSLSRAHAHP